MSDPGYRVFRRATWLSIPPVRRIAVWPILLVVLPILWELVKAFVASRVHSADASPDPASALRSLAASLPAESWARRAWDRAEADVAAGWD